MNGCDARHIGTWAGLLAALACGVAAHGQSGAASRPTSSRSAVVSPLMVGSVARISADSRTVIAKVEGPLPDLGSRAWLFDATMPLARGTVVLRRAAAVGISIDWREGRALVAGQRAVILRDTAGSVAATQPASSPAARYVVISSDPTVQEAMLTVDAGGGPNVGETLLVERAGWPVARLVIKKTVSNEATASVTQLVANVKLVAGDIARAWPDAGERATGRLRSAVLRIVEQRPDRELWIPWPGADSAHVGDHWVIQRNGEYVGLAVTSIMNERFVLATTTDALCRSPIKAGDVAIRRPSVDVMSGATPLYIFRVEGPYGLVSAGTTDGLQMEMPLTLVRNGRAVATLRVDNVNDDHCGVTLDGDASVGASSSAPVSTREAERVEMRPWDTVYVKPPVVRSTGRVTRVRAESGTLEISYAGAVPAAGTRVEIGDHAAGAVILVVDNGRAVAAPMDERALRDEWVGQPVSSAESAR